MQELVTVPGDPLRVLAARLVPKGQDGMRQSGGDRSRINHDLLIAIGGSERDIDPGPLKAATRAWGDGGRANRMLSMLLSPEMPTPVAG